MTKIIKVNKQELGLTIAVISFSAFALVGLGVAIWSQSQIDLFNDENPKYDPNSYTCIDENCLSREVYETSFNISLIIIGLSVLGLGVIGYNIQNKLRFELE